LSCKAFTKLAPEERDRIILDSKTCSMAWFDMETPEEEGGVLHDVALVENEMAETEEMACAYDWMRIKCVTDEEEYVLWKGGRGERLEEVNRSWRKMSMQNGKPR
jgi:hypothetical protein